MTMLALVLVGYTLCVLGVGVWASRRTARSPEEYFLAGRTLGPFVLFMALFGTNVTAFVLVGIPAKAYQAGIGVFGMNAPIIALGIPLTFWAIGSPARRMSARLGALTPAELFARRFDSPAYGMFLFAVYTVFTIPYMVTAVKGASVALEIASAGSISEWQAGLGVIIVALAYTSLGGMRATAWTNVIQGVFFLLFVVIAATGIAIGLGGPAAATAAVASEKLRVGDAALFEPAAWTSWAVLISLTVIAFPHMLVRLMAGANERALKSACLLYPPAMLILWLPVVLIGVWASGAIPGLTGPAIDQVFSRMTASYLPPFLATLGVIAVLATVMSTLDGQILTLGSMLTRDVLDKLLAPDSKRDVRAGRLFGVIIAGAVWFISVQSGATIFRVATLAFSGYATLVPSLFLGVRWRRFTRGGALASVLVGNALLAIAELGDFRPGGFLPVFWAVLGAGVAGVVGSLLTRAPEAGVTAVAFGDTPPG